MSDLFGNHIVGFPHKAAQLDLANLMSKVVTFEIAASIGANGSVHSVTHL